MTGGLDLESKRIRASSFFWAGTSGLALTSAFPDAGLYAFAWVALALLFYALRGADRKQAFLLGLTAGMAHYLSLLYWIANTLHLYGPLPLSESTAALFLLSFYLSLYMALFSTAMVPWVRSQTLLPFFAPVVWVCLEFLRTHLFSGFPWGLLGYSQYKNIKLIQAADIFGVWGISFILVMANSVFFLAVSCLSEWGKKRADTRKKACIFWLVLFVGVMAAFFSYGSRAVSENDRIAASARRIRVAVVQGNIPQAVKWDRAYERQTTEKYLRLSSSLPGRRPDLIVWPETAVPFYFFYDTLLTNRILETARKVGCFFLVGTPTYEYTRNNKQLNIYNSALLIDPEGRPAGRYDKVHLVPFGEYVPFRKWLPFVGKIVSQFEDFSSGDFERVLRMKDTLIAPQICYEIIFPGLSAAMVRVGAGIIVNITNDAWFGRTSAPLQHFSMAVFRAVENRRVVVRAANTGISGFIGPSGRILATSGLFKTEVIAREIPVVQGHTSFYTRHGDFLPVICIAISLLIGLNGIRRRYATRKMGLQA